jgi:predicted ATP-dependent Lon-type protease
MQKISVYSEKKKFGKVYTVVAGIDKEFQRGDNGAKRALIPIENKRNFLDVSADIMEHVDPSFFGDLKQAAFKALGLN